MHYNPTLRNDRSKLSFPLALSFLLVLLLGLVAPPPPALAAEDLWPVLLNSARTQSDGVTAIDTDAQGNVFVTGSCFTASDHLRGMTAKYDGAGHLQWVVKSNSRIWTSDNPIALAVDPAGDVVVLSSSWRDASKLDYLVVKYDGTTGKQEWASTYNGESNDEDSPRGMALDASGAVFVTGLSQYVDGAGGPEQLEYTTVKFGSNGRLLWATHYAAAGNAIATALAVTSAGDVIVTGGLSNGAGTSGHTFRYSGATGAEVWHIVEPAFPHKGIFGVAVTLDAADEVYVGAVVENVSSPTASRFYRYSGATGVRLWQKPHSGTSQESPRFLAVGADGGLFAAGWVGAGLYTLRLDRATGNSVWERKHHASNHDEMVHGMKVSPAGHLFLTGRDYTQAQGNHAIAFSYDAATGQPGWFARYAATGRVPTSAYCMALDADEKVYVAGAGQGDLGQDFLILKYEPEGVGLPRVGAPELTGKALTVSQTQLTWLRADGTPLAYDLERSEAGGPFSLVKSVDRLTSSILDAGLTPGTVYQYRMLARFATESLTSNVVRVTMPFAESGGKLSVASKLAFGKLKAGTPKTKKLLLRNQSTTQPLRVQLLEVYPSVYSIDGATSLTLPPRGSYQLPVTLRPKGPGTWNGGLSLQTSDPERLQVSIGLTGTAK